MKTFLLALTLLLFCFGIANADGITVSNFEGSWDGGTKVRTGRPVTWTINIDTPSEGIMGSTNGFKVFISFSPSPYGMLDTGPGFTPITYSTIADFSNYATYTESYFGKDQYGAYIVGFGGVSFDSPVYIFNSPTWTITTMVDTTKIGYYLCLDSSYYPPGGAWVWDETVIGTYIPSWSGPHCYMIAIKDVCCLSSGDVNWDDKVLVDDLVYLVNYLFKGGPPTPCLEAGDVNLDYRILVNDLTFLVNYLFKSGPTPPPCY